MKTATLLLKSHQAYIYFENYSMLTRNENKQIVLEESSLLHCHLDFLLVKCYDYCKSLFVLAKFKADLFTLYEIKLAKHKSLRRANN